MSGKILMIDGHSMMNRAYYALPDFTSADGRHTGAILGFLNILTEVLKMEDPQYLAVAFDEHAPTFRHQMYAAYKGTRHPMPEELREQIPLIREILVAMGVPVVTKEGYEADDILGTLSRKAEKKDIDCTILSGDRDLLQLATKHTKILLPKTKGGQSSMLAYYEDDVMAEYGITPAQVIEIKALEGDSSDNIPGLPGVGKVTAKKLLQTYGTAENAHDHLEELKPARVQAAFRDHWDLAVLSRTLATINTDSPVDLDWDRARLGNLFTPEAYVYFKELGLKRYLALYQKTDKADGGEKKLEIRVIRDREAAEKIFARMKEAPSYGLYILSSFDKKSQRAEIAGAGVAFSETEVFYLNAAAGTESSAYAGGENSEAAAAGTENSAYAGGENSEAAATGTENSAYAGGKNSEAAADENDHHESRNAEEDHGISAQDIRRALQDAMASDQVKSIAAFDIKEQLRAAGPVGSGIAAEDSAKFFDAGIAAYLLNPLGGNYGYDAVAAAFAPALEIRTPEEIFQSKKIPSPQKMTEAQASEFAGYAAVTALLSAEPMEKELAAEGMDRLFRETEMPLIFTMRDMERIGMRVLPEELSAYGEKLAAGIAETEKRIYEEAHEEFNINSPKQLGTVLFENLKLPGGKKTKTGWSTAADVLEKLAPDYPVVRDILEYRQLTKLKSTYADGLAGEIADDGRIHTTFNQTITATGRISSTEPNLQNIPVRVELGKQLRKIFVPADGCVYIDADYSQIELRVLASLSGDEKLISAYREAKDIHRITASQVFHVPFDEVTPLMRRRAKAVNFGIVYGISAYGLSQDLDIPREEASEYIDSYYETYPGIRGYLEGLVASAKKNGYSVTYYGRRRPMPELKSSNFMQRQFGERVAKNAPIQGTAADIIKIAMNRVHDRLIRSGLKARLILQVHDELLIEAPEEEAEEVKKILEEEMTGATDLAVRMEVDVESGSSWYEAH